MTSNPQFLYGYSGQVSVRAGETVDFMLGADRAAQADIQLVRLLHGDCNPEGPGFVEEEVASDLPGTIAIGPQRTQRGAFAIVDDPQRHLATIPVGTLHAFIKPTLFPGHEQVIAGQWDARTQSGYLLLIAADGCLTLRLGDGTTTRETKLSRRLAPKIWYLVAATWNVGEGRASLRQIACINRWNSKVGLVVPYALSDSVETSGPLPFAPGGDAFLFAGVRGRDGLVGALFNGKIDRTAIHHAELSGEMLAAIAGGAGIPADSAIACWDTSLGYDDGGIGDVIVDTGPHGLDALGVNRPIRGMTGWNWDGRNDSFRLCPAQYGGIAFHEDALIDCQWPVTVQCHIPDDARSGVYALRVRSEGMEDHVPFFVRAARPTAPIAIQMASFTYLAYANEHLAFDAPIAQAICANTPILGPEDLHWKASDAFGFSTYDVHCDGAGVCYSSWHRPILNMRPRYRMPSTGMPWALPADLSLIWWMEQSGFDYEIITDHDLDAEGVDAIRPYKMVINCTHPEYYSQAMLDSTEDYLASGGRVLYLGGNGYYWVTEVRPQEPWCIEVRKLDTGSRAWQAEPGEGYLTTTGCKSGLWRARGRAPQKTVGVGFTTEGMDESQPFVRMEDSFDPAIAWMFDGIGEDELIGDFGLGLNGAAGIEMDRYDLALGTPPHALLVASSFNHSDNYPLVSEDIAYAFPGRGGTQDPQVRADIVFFPTAGNGAVFATGSIAWSQALPWNGGDNNVARMTSNVIRAFLRDGPV